MRNVGLLIIFILIANNPAAFGSPSFLDNWSRNSDIPLCPDSGVTILPDTYPAIAYTTWAANPEDNLSFTAPLVRAIVSGAKKFKTRVYIEGPFFNDLKSKLKMNADQLSAIISIGSPVRKLQFKQWQQDYFESFVSVKTGDPVINLLGYPESDDENDAATEVSGFVDAMKRYTPQISFSDVIYPLDLKDQYEPDDRHQFGEEGGNVEALPGGYCLHGSNQRWGGFGDQYCGSHDNEVSLDTNWLGVGHADEVVSTIPVENTSQPECGFVIALPGPALAVRLLDAERWSDPVLGKLPDLKRDPLNHLRRLTLEAQPKIDQAKQIITDKLKERLPQCSIKFIELPILYGRDWAGDQPTKMVSRTANLVNGLNADGVVITQDPLITAFRKEALRVYHDAGVKSIAFIPKQFSRINGGVHCATHAIRVCRPGP